MKNRLPGVAVAALIALLAGFVSDATGLLGSASWSILIGLALGSTPPAQRYLKNGSKWTEKHVLQLAVALLGAQISLSGVPELGNALLAILLVSVLLMAAGRWLLPRLGVSPAQAWLIASGETVCGSAAVASVSAGIHAKPEDSGAAVLAVNAFSTIGLFVIPASLQWLPFDALGSAWWTGGYLQSAGHAIAGGFAMGDGTGELATTLKMSRVLLLLPLMVLSSLLFRQKRPGQGLQPAANLRVLPTFLWVFVALLVVVQLFPLPDALRTPWKTANAFLLHTALAAIGMNIRISDLRRSGKRILLSALSLTFLHILLLAFFGYLLGVL